MWSVQVILLLATPCLALGNGTQSRIMNGHPMRIDEASYMVAFTSLLVAEHELGTGTILTDTFVITVAHIFTENPGKVLNTKDNTVIRYGCSTVQAGEGSVAEIEEIMIHSKYKGEEVIYSQYDMAVVKTNAPISFRVNYATPMALANPSVTFDVGASCLILGYGSTGFPNDPQKLRGTMLTLRDIKTCEDLIDVGPGLICGHSDKNSGPCEGDSGGPLFCDGKMYAEYIEGWDCDEKPEMIVALYVPFRQREKFIRQSTRNMAHWEK